MPPDRSEELREAALHRGSHLQILACAGAGKTEAVAWRVVTLLAERVEPGAIVAFTFTEKAAAALRERIENHVRAALGPEILNRITPLFVGTIHSYCLRVLQESVPRYGAFDVLDEHRLAGLVSREYKRLGLEGLGIPSKWKTIDLFLSNVEVVENERIRPDRLGKTPFRSAYENLRATLDRYRYLTYSQIISRAVEELRRPEVFERIHGRLRHLIVDEYQDVNPPQEELIRLLSASPVQVCVVGDDDQSIYGWRGSRVENILEFGRRYRGTHTVGIPRNRRSRPGIIVAANRFAKTIAPRLEKEMQPFRSGTGREVVCWHADDAESEAEKVVDAIRRLRERGYACRDVAILLRSVRTSAAPFQEALRAADIPYVCAGRTGLFRHPEVRALARAYTWLADFDWREGFAASEPVERDGLVREFTGIFGLPRSASSALRAFFDDWYKKARDDDYRENLVRDYYRLLRVLGVHDWELSDSRIAVRMGTLARFSQLLVDFESVTRRARPVEDGEMRGGLSGGIYFHQRLVAYLQYYASERYEDFDSEPGIDLDAVTISTVHQAKGLEWPIVFVPALTARRFPAFRTGSEREWLLPRTLFDAAKYEGTDVDERRLFYVAMTRARDGLYLSGFKRTSKQAQKPSPYIQEISGGKYGDTIPLPTPGPPGSESVAAEVPVISFSDLASYERCPLSYRLRTLLGFEPPLAKELGYGKAVHHVLRRIADVVRDERRLPRAPEVERIFEDEFYLPFADRPAYTKMRAAAERLVSRYLGDHGDDLFRIWEAERPFDLHIEEGIVSGRADVILDQEEGEKGRLALLDYKTSFKEAETDLYAFQLRVYTAAGRAEGYDVRAAYVHDLKEGRRHAVPLDDGSTKEVRAKSGGLLRGIRSGSFDANPGSHCRSCDVRAICRHGPSDSI